MYYRLIFVFVVLSQTGLYLYSNHAHDALRTKTLKTMQAQSDALKFQNSVIETQAKTIRNQDAALKLAVQSMQDDNAILRRTSKVLSIAKNCVAYR